MKIFTRAIAVVLLSFATLAQAEVAVIVSATVDRQLSQAEVANVFLGKDKSMTALDLQDWGPVKDAFYSQVMKKTEAQMTSYWSGLIFTGKAQPPQSVADDAAAVARIAENANMIGYVASDAVTDKVKVLFTLP